MYKSKLQEFCHRKQCQLPEYETTREGPPHNPRFHTTVTVNSLSFSNLQPCKTTKDSQNDAARVALLYLTASSSSPSSASVGSSSSSVVQPNIRETNQTPLVNATSQVDATAAVVEDANRSKDQKALLTVMPNLYKNQLQSYAQKRNLALPTYSCEREGPPHASRFKCKVTIDEQTYESPTFFPTLKEAEHGAAKVALMSLSSDATQEVDSMLYKNLLQELAQKECYALPIYKTNQSGEPHMPTFVSTVEVEGEVFTGQEAKTKKQAEMSAAKVAYITLKERRPSQGLAFLSPACGAQADNSSSYLQSNVTANPHQDIQPTGHTVFNPKSWELAEDNEVNEEVDQQLFDLFPQPEITPNRKRESPSTVLSAPSMPANGPASSSLPCDVSGGTVTNSPIRIRVLPCMPNMQLPKDSTVVHRDERFVALRLGSLSNQ